jgi:soluble lytic murein transglycosylase
MRSLISVLLGLVIALGTVAVPAWKIRQRMRENQFDPLILQAAAEHGVDPNLIKAVIWRESKFRPDARGDAGEMGLMQVMPIVGQEWTSARGEKNFDSTRLLDPLTNVRIGSWYLAKGLSHWEKAARPVPLALAQYNAGRSNVLKWVNDESLLDSEKFITQIQFPSTRAYVRDIIRQHQKYRDQGEF